MWVGLWLMWLAARGRHGSCCVEFRWWLEIFFFFGLFVWMDEWINAIVGVRDIHIYFYIYICM